MPTDTVYVLDEDGLPQPKPQEEEARPVATTAKKRAKQNRWSDTDIEMLMKAVESAASNRKAFEQVAAETGRSVGTVQQKFYSLQRKKGVTGRVVASPSQRGRTVKPAASRMDVSSLSTDELVGLASEVQSEMARRQKALAEAMGAFG